MNPIDIETLERLARDQVPGRTLFTLWSGHAFEWPFCIDKMRWAKLEASVLALLTRLREAEKDMARMDWLDQQKPEVTIYLPGGAAKCINRNRDTYLIIPLRAAIDAANPEAGR